MAANVFIDSELNSLMVNCVYRRFMKKLRFFPGLGLGSLVGLLPLLLCPSSARAQAPPPMFVVGNANGPSGAQVLVPVEVDTFTNIGIFQFSFHWNASQAVFIDAEQFGLVGLTAGSFGTTDTNTGTLRVSWDDPNGKGESVADGTTLFAVRLQLIGTNGSASALFIDGSPLSLEVADGDLNPLTAVLVSGQLTTGQPNTPPILMAIGDKTVNEGDFLSFTAHASDADVPAQTLTFSLDPGFPSGASINATNGIFMWTPTEAQGPGSYPVTIRVMDSASPPASVTETITITVNESNSAPVLAVVANKTVLEGTLLTFTNSATDSDIPAQTLSFSLTGAPTGASINASNGVFSWTPSHAQAGNVFTFTIQVTDDGIPPLGDSQTISVTVDATNSPPVLAAIADKTVNEGSLLIFTNSATDANTAQTLTFSLLTPPSGAQIDPSTGVFTWTPSEAQGPSNFPVTIQVTDSGTPPLSDSRSFTITVNEVNSAPLLAPISDQTIAEGFPLTFLCVATDSDLPPQTLAFSLMGAPAGATIGPSSGIFSWTPPVTSITRTNALSVIVTDDGSPPLSATQSFSILVLKTNHPPVFEPLGTYPAEVLLPVKVTNVVADLDLPTNQITFAIASGPKGVHINKFTGIVTWVPGKDQARTTNVIFVSATDDGVPPLSSTNSFQVTVGDYLELSLGRLVLLAGQTGSVPVAVTNSTPVTNVTSLLLVSPTQLTDLSLSGLASELQSGTLTPQGSGLWMLAFAAVSGQVLQPGQLLGQLGFTAISNQPPAFVPLLLSNVTAIEATGQPLSRTLENPGRAAVVASEPLMESVPTTNVDSTVILYGRIGSNYLVQATADPAPSNPNWQTYWQGTLTNLTQILPPQTNSANFLFFRSNR